MLCHVKWDPEAHAAEYEVRERLSENRREERPDPEQLQQDLGERLRRVVRPQVLVRAARWLAERADEEREEETGHRREVKGGAPAPGAADDSANTEAEEDADERRGAPPAHQARPPLEWKGVGQDR